MEDEPDRSSLHFASGGEPLYLRDAYAKVIEKLQKGHWQTFRSSSSGDTLVNTALVAFARNLD